MDHARSLDGSQASPFAVSATPPREPIFLLILMADLCLSGPLRLPSPQDTIYLLQLMSYQSPLLSPLRLPVPPSRLFVEVLDSTANFAFYFVAIPNDKCETV
jgi:hypothetical protein